MTLTKDILIFQALTFLKESYLPKSQILAHKRHLKEIKQPSLPKKEKIAAKAPVFEPIILKKSKEKPALLPDAPLQKAAEKEKPIKPRAALNFAEFSKAALQLYPRFPLKESPPDDRAALAMSDPSYVQALDADVVIFTFQETPESDLFLQNIRQAITRYHTPASLFFVSSCKTENELSLFLEEMKAKLILAPYNLLQDKTFLPFIRQLPVSKEYFIHKSPLILLEPFTQYFTHPQKKKALWQTLCTLLTAPSTPASS